MHMDVDLDSLKPNADGTKSVPAMYLKCQDCGHIVTPGESCIRCSICGSRKLRMEMDPERTVTIKCAA
jgi:Zn finger protein HypA/HybF involved in hydrogenase expression